MNKNIWILIITLIILIGQLVNLFFLSKDYSSLSIIISLFSYLCILIIIQFTTENENLVLALGVTIFILGMVFTAIYEINHNYGAISLIFINFCLILFVSFILNKNKIQKEKDNV